MSERKLRSAKSPIAGSTPQEFLAPQDPLARPSYPRRPERAVRVGLQLCEEHTPLVGQIQAANKPELDMTAFVQAVEAAFPEPRDPVGRPILPPRPERAARPFLLFEDGAATGESVPTVPAGKKGDPELVTGQAQATGLPFRGFESVPAEAAVLQSFSERPLVKPVLEAAASMMLDTPYDPILEDAHAIFPSPRPVRLDRCARRAAGAGR